MLLLQLFSFFLFILIAKNGKIYICQNFGEQIFDDMRFSICIFIREYAIMKIGFQE